MKKREIDALAARYFGEKIAEIEASGESSRGSGTGPAYRRPLSKPAASWARRNGALLAAAAAFAAIAFVPAALWSGKPGFADYASRRIEGDGQLREAGRDLAAAAALLSR